MITATNDLAIQELTIASLHAAISRLAIRDLQSPPAISQVETFRQVERLMRIAIALAGQGTFGLPHVKVHNLPDVDYLPGMLSVPLTDLLAARGAESLPEALNGKPDAILALERISEHLLLTEEIQLG